MDDNNNTNNDNNTNINIIWQMVICHAGVLYYIKVKSFDMKKDFGVNCFKYTCISNMLNVFIEYPLVNLFSQW